MKSEAELKRDKATLIWARAARRVNDAWAEVRVAKQVAMAADKLEAAARTDMEKASYEFEQVRVSEVWGALALKEVGNEECARLEELEARKNDK